MYRLFNSASAIEISKSETADFVYDFIEIHNNKRATSNFCGTFDQPVL